MTGRHKVPDLGVGEHHEGNFRVYMRHKNQKLAEQFNAGETRGLLSTLFDGLVFFLDGHTDPPHEELRHLITLHGGQLDQYLTSRVTHVIATHLPHAKIKLIMEQKLAKGAHQQTPIVKPTFIVDSIAQGRLMPPAQYLIDALRQRHGASMTSFLRPSSSSVPPQPPNQTSGPGGASSEGRVPSPRRQRREENSDVQGLSTPEPTPPPLQPPSPARPLPAAVPAVDNSAGELDEEGGTAAGVEEGLPEALAVGSPSPNPLHRKKRPRTTKEDPDFISNFFQSSRLHFIGSFKGQLADMVARMKLTPPTWPPPADPTQRVVIHVDMDCFFVSVLVRDRPDLQDKPVAVAHTNFAGTSEVSSCNYLARKAGVTAGMWMGEAKRLCPQITVLMYDFEQYEEVSLRQMYPIFYQESAKVMPVSVDEAYLELAPGSDGVACAQRLRQRIMDATRCPASAGISCNMLLARLATKKAKPNGQYLLSWDDAPAYLAALPVGDLPGVGYDLVQRLNAKSINTCTDLLQYPLPALKSLFGQATGQKLYNACRGVDDRPLEVEPVRKSVAADVNWGMRFSQDEQIFDFLPKLAHEVATRLDKARAKGRSVTLRVKKSTYGANEPPKFLGCGPCENFSRSETLSRPTASAETIALVANRLYRQLQKEKDLPPDWVRGMGIQITKLEIEGVEGGRPPSIKAWLNRPQQHQGDEEEGAKDHDEEEEEGEALGDGVRRKEGWEAGATDLPAAKAQSRRDKSKASIVATPPIINRRVQERAAPSPARAARLAAAVPSPPPWQPSAVLERVTLSQVDPEVLDSLPADVREEIMRHVLQLPPPVAPAYEEPVAKAPPPQAVTLRPVKNRQRQLRIEDYNRLKSFETHQGDFNAAELQALPFGVRLSVAEHPRAYQNQHGDLHPDFMAAEGFSNDSVPSFAAPLVEESVAPVPCDEPINAACEGDIIEEEDEEQYEGEAPQQHTEQEGEEEGRESDEVEDGFEEGQFVHQEVSEVRRAVLRWVEQVGEAPRTAHLQLLAAYLCEKVEEGQGHSAVLLLKALGRWAEGQEEAAERGWRKAVSSLSKVVEQRVEARERAFESSYV